LTDWDKLWEEPWASYTKYSTTEYYDYEIWVNQVRAVGDEMQQENVQLRKDVKELANMGSDDLKKRVACQKENEMIRVRESETMKMWAETIESLNEDEKKLKLIRDLVDLWDQYDSIGWHAKQLQAEIRGVLGVRKEMQEKDESC